MQLLGHRCRKWCLHYELDDFDWSTIIVCSVPARAAASEDSHPCYLRCIAHWSRFVLLVTIVITQGGRYLRGTEVRVEKK